MSAPVGGLAHLDMPSSAGWRARALTPAETAWVLLLPCALLALAALVWLGPPLGHALFSPGSDALWPPEWPEAHGRPEPTEQARYILAVLAPLVLAAAILVVARRGPTLRPRLLRVLVRCSQAATLAFVVAALVGQRHVAVVERPLPRLLEAGMLAAAAALVLAAVLGLRRPGVAARAALLARETTARRVACLTVAVVVATTYLLQGVYTDRLAEEVGTMDWTLNDAIAVLDGRTPLVDYHVLYAKLLPYPTALAVWLLGTTALAYSLVLTVLSVLSLVAVYAVFRLLLRSSLLALGLFVPFVAVGDVGHQMSLNPLWPMRYGGAYLMLWLTARHVVGHAPRRVWVLFLVGGLVAINNLEFGAGATIATLLVLLATQRPRSWRAGAGLLGAAAAGLCGAVALVAAISLLRAGALPDPALLFEWPRIFSRLGWFAVPIPALGLHLALYATFVAAIALSAVRLLSADGDELLTGMLLWSGVFGLLAGSYYVGVSDEWKLESLLSAWALALALLTIACVRELSARGWRRPTLPQLLVLLGFGLALCSLVQASPPNEQLARLTKPLPDPVARPAAERFIRQLTRPRETVVILLPMSYRIAHELRLRNVSPYGTQEAIVTRGQLQTVIDTAERERAHAIFLKLGRIATAQLRMLDAAGFRVWRWQEAQPPVPGIVALRGG